MIKIAAMVGTPDLRQETLAVYAGDLDTAINRLGNLGYDGVELMVRDPDLLDAVSIRRSLDANGLRLAGLCSGHVFGDDGLGLVGPDPQICQQAMAWDAQVRRGFAKLYELIGPMLSAASVEELANIVLDGLLPAISADVGAVLLFPEGTGDRTNPDGLVVIARRSPPDSAAPPTSRTVSRRVLCAGEAILAMNIERDPNRAKLGSIQEMRSAICAPIRGATTNHGLLHAYCSRSDHSLDFVSLEIILAGTSEPSPQPDPQRRPTGLCGG